jgi:hypothetical protein
MSLVTRVVKTSPAMNHGSRPRLISIWSALATRGLKPQRSTARLLAARDADEVHPLRTEEEATEVVEYLWRLEREQATG